MEKTDSFLQQPSFSFIPEKKIADHEHSKSCRALFMLILIVSVSLAVALFLLPTVFYYIDDTSFSLADLNLGNLSASTSDDSSAANATAGVCVGVPLWGEEEMAEGGSCNLYPYQGAVCRDFLQTWEQCAMGKGTVQLLATSVDELTTLEADLVDLKENILDSSLVSVACKEAALPFLCQYFFKLGSCSAGQSLTSSQDECLRISQSPDVCLQEWVLAGLTEFGTKLPQCDQLPPASNASQELLNITVSPINASNVSIGSNLTCRDDFIAMDHVCWPRCDRFKSNTERVTRSVLKLEILIVVVGLLVSVGVMVASCVQFKTSTNSKYPFVYMIMVVMDYVLAVGMILISAFDRYDLLCSSINLIESIASSTPFCMILGAVFHYAIVHMTILWLTHISLFFFQTFWPQSYLNKVGTVSWNIMSIILVLGGIVVALPGVVVSLSVSDHNYRIVQFPPSVCLPSNSMWFYSVTLPLSVMLAAGTVLLMLVVWRQCRCSCDGDKPQAFSATDKKLFVYFITFLLFGAAVLVLGSLVDAYTASTTEKLNQYFLCEATGYVPGKCSRAEIESLVVSLLYVIASPLMTAIAVAVFVNVVNWTKIWSCVMKLTKQVAQQRT